MSKAFNLKYLSESSPSLESMVTKDTVRETYLNTTIASLREMNALISQNTKKLYTQILEADSKSEENKMFAEYFGQFKDIFSKFTNNIVGMRDRLIINLDNMVDSNSDLVNDDQYISDFTGTFSYSGWEFVDDLNNPHFPRMNLREIYQKDFDYLGKVMQDKGISASPTERIKIIAQVCNEFSKHGRNGKYIKSLLKELVNCDEEFSSISECLYKAFRESKDFEVDKSSLYRYKEDLINIEEYKNTITIMCDNLISDIQFIADDITSYLFRNQDNKLRIKTPTDGVIDRDYRLDTYAMNQVDIFMKSKVSQINKVLNVFCMALSIKIDAIIDCINQSKDILRTVKGNENIDAITTDDDGPIPNVNPDEVSDDINSDDIDTENDEPESTEDTSENDNTEPESGETTEAPESTDDELDGETTNTPDLPPEAPIDAEGENDDTFELESFLLSNDFDFPVMESSEETDSRLLNYEADYFIEAELFEATLHELDLMYEMYEIDNFVNKSILREADEQKPTGWVAVVRNLKKLWDKFKDIVVVRSKDKIGYLKQNEKFINKAVSIEGDFILKYTPDFGVLDKIVVKPFDQVKNSLESEAACFKAMVGNIEIKDGESISNALQRAALGEEQRAPLNNIKPNVKEAYNFCVNDYANSVDSIKKMNAELEKAQDKAIAAKKKATNESSVDESVRAYVAARAFLDTYNPKLWFDVPIENGNFERIHPRLLTYVSKCKTEKDIAFLRKDMQAATPMLTKLRDNCKAATKNPDDNRPEYKEVRRRMKKGLSVEKIDSHIKWLKDVYAKALSDRLKEIKSKPTKESFENYTIEDYFREAGEAEPDKNKDNQDKEKDSGNKSSSSSNKSENDGFDVYFKTASKIIAAKMTIYQKLFNELYAFCKWHIKKAGGSSDGGDDKAEKPTDNKNETPDKVDLS